MYTFFYTAGLLVTVASVAAANPQAQTGQAHGNPHKAPITTTAPATTTTTTASATATLRTPPKPNPIAANIATHPSLQQRIDPILHRTGMTLNQASTGFKNQGQFISALHASKNLDIPFKDLRTQMVTNQKSLGPSIQALKRLSDSTAAVRTAQRQADEDVKTTTTTTSTTRAKLSPRPKSAGQNRQ